MKTFTNGYGRFEYDIIDGKYTLDGYDCFDTLAELEYETQLGALWVRDAAYRKDGKWVIMM